MIHTIFFQISKDHVANPTKIQEKIRKFKPLPIDSQFFRACTINQKYWLIGRYTIEKQLSI